MARHQAAFLVVRIGGKVSPFESGITFSSAVGDGVVVLSVYLTNSYRPVFGASSPVLYRLFGEDVISDLSSYTFTGVE